MHSRTRADCAVAKANYNDPIVFPGQEGAAHVHIFWGNVDLDHTTIGSDGINRIREGTTGSSCRGGGLGANVANKNAYWVAPVLTAEDQLVVPSDVRIRYSHGVSTTVDVQAWPVGLTMIAGSASTTSPSDTDAASFILGS